MASPTYVASTTQGAQSTTINVAAPSGVASGDHNLIWLGVPSSTITVTSVPSGWTLERTQTNTNDSTPFTLRCYKSSTSTSSASFTVSSSTTLTAVRSAYRGGAGVESSVGTNDASSTSNHALANATTTVVDSLVVAAGYEDSSGTSKTHTMTGWNERNDYATSGLTRVGMIATYDIVKATAGTQGGTIVSTSSDFMSTISVVLTGIAVSAPTVDAGADVGTHYANNEFTRTATENNNGATITSRAWTIQSGPSGVGSTIGTAAALSWTPTVTGTYVLRYSATNSAGTGNDDMSITVVAQAAPTVNAGTDVTGHIVNTAFSRTATESANGASITSRAWTIQSGPSGVGNTIGTAAALSWTPTVTGDYVLQYAATNSIGTGSDTVAVTVLDAPPPPIVDAGNDVDAHTSDTTFTRTATENNNGSTITSRAWTIEAGPAGVGSTLGTTVTVSWTPTVTGTYSIKYAATNANGTGSHTIHVTVIAVNAPSTTGRYPAHPGELLRISPEDGRNHFNIGIGIDNGGADGYQAGDTIHTDQALIASGFTHGPPAQTVPKFVLVEDRSAVQFRIGVNDGTTSSGTQYPRSELREQNADGTLAAWNGGVDTHWMKWRFRVTRVAPTKPWVCVGQIHDASSDLIRLQTETGGSGPTGLRLRARHTVPGGSETGYVAMASYTIGQWVNGELWVVNGLISLILDGVTVLSGLDGDTTGCYFKAGCYAQSNTTTEGGDSSQWFSTEIAYLGSWHTGQPTLAPPAYTGPLIAQPTSGFLPFFDS